MKFIYATQFYCDKSKQFAKLTEKQKQLDVNGDGKIDKTDLKRLRNGEKPKK